MKNGLTLFFWVFVTLALSWSGLLLTAHRQIGGLAQFKDPADDSLHPAAMSGLAHQGLLVYQDLGCVTCHTQQVRQHGFGNDLAEGRKWGERGSYARDYIRDDTVLIGQNRLGPDLRNVGARIPDTDYFYKLLYAPESRFAGAPIAHGMPAHRFLFDVHPVAGRQPSEHALQLSSDASPGPGLEVVPTPRAVALVAYLQSLKDTYDYPVERERNTPAAAEGEGHGAKAEPAPAAPAKAEGAAKTPAPAEGQGAKAEPAAAAPAKPEGAAQTPAPAATPAAPTEKPKEGGH